MRPYQFIEGPWENSELPTIVEENPHGGDPYILAVIKRVYNPGALYELCRMANDATEARPASAEPILFPTLSGMVDLARLDPDAISIEAMSHGLAQINRYSGALELPLSVAQHSIVVLEIFKQLFPEHAGQGIYALLHDGHEYLIGDVTTPTVRLLARSIITLPAILNQEKERIDVAIRARFGLPEPSAAVREAIAHADHVALATEWHRLMPADCGSCPVPEKPMKSAAQIRTLSWIDADIAFLAAFEREMATFQLGSGNSDAHI